MRNPPDLQASLSDWLAYIENLHAANIDMGLDRIRLVYEELKLSQLAEHTVVVAGTNGKGSTVAMLAALCQAAGKRVATYTSPHIHHFNERLKINGEPVSDRPLVEAFQRVESARKSASLTYFEFTTLAILLLIAEAKPDVAVLEIGLGGRLDAVNIVDNDLSIITSIGLDHTDWLGETLEQIGREKAGVMRAGKPVLLGPDMPVSVREHGNQLGASMLTYGEHFYPSEDHLVLAVQSLDQTRAETELRVPMPVTRLPKSNVSLALQAYACMDIEPALERIISCLDSFSLPGRLQVIKTGGVEVILDVGHNAQAAAFLAEYLKNSKAADTPVFAVYSALADKDVDAVVRQLSEQVDCWFIAPLDNARAAPIEKISAAISAYSQNVLSFESIPQALEAAIEQASSRPAIVLSFGSFFLVQAADAYLKTL